MFKWIYLIPLKYKYILSWYQEEENTISIKTLPSYSLIPLEYVNSDGIKVLQWKDRSTTISSEDIKNEEATV